jgi:hypothetical protein
MRSDNHGWWFVAMLFAVAGFPASPIFSSIAIAGLIILAFASLF